MLAEDIKSITTSVTKNWTKQRKREEREARARYNRGQYLYSNRVNQTDVAVDVIPEAYAKASGNGCLPAHARQIFYAARKEIQDRTGRPLDSVYFTQTLLPKYINRHPEAQDWWVVYDARGHLTEPHTRRTVPLGTLEVETYLTEVTEHAPGATSYFDPLDTHFPTNGPQHRYDAILFIEKEGFNPLFKEVKLAERYDIGIMSTKGQSVVAARRVVDELCHVAAGVPVLVLHDFDKEGFLISQRLTSVSAAAYVADRVRYRFANEINVIDLGLRLKDVHEWNLEAESVRFKGGFDADTITTADEREFLRGNQRVELNAFTSADFIKWIEGKLEQHGIKKVIPDEEALKMAFRRAYQTVLINRTIEEAQQEAEDRAEEAVVPKDLAAQVASSLKDDPAAPWDSIVARIAEECAELDDEKA